MNSQKVVMGPYTVNMNSLENFPYESNLIARTIAAWSFVDFNLSELVANILSTDPEAICSVFTHLQSASTKSEILKKLISAALRDDPEGLDLSEKFISMMKHSHNDRDNFAHKLWATSQDGKHLLRVDPNYMAMQVAKAISGNQKKRILNHAEEKEARLKNVVPYTKKKLEDAFDSALGVSLALSELVLAFGDDAVLRQECRAQLRAWLQLPSAAHIARSQALEVKSGKWKPRPPFLIRLEAIRG